MDAVAFRITKNMILKLSCQSFWYMSYASCIVKVTRLKYKYKSFRFLKFYLFFLLYKSKHLIKPNQNLIPTSYLDISDTDIIFIIFKSVLNRYETLIKKIYQCQ